jgi:hypothetical protein
MQKLMWCARGLGGWPGIAAILALSMWAATSADGQVNYVGKVLYPLTPPSGLQVYQVNSATGGQTAAEGIKIGTGNSYALVWTSNGTALNLGVTALAGLNSPVAQGTDGIQQVGYASYPDPSHSGYIFSHAVLWSGTSASAIDINPTDLSGFNYSVANGVSGNQQVGYAQGSTQSLTQAILWHGTAASAVDLNPSGFNGSEAFATDGTQQVGEAGGSAFLWSGTAASAVDLAPINLPQFFGSTAEGVGGGQQVGFGEGANEPLQALLWSGTGASAVDLNPAEYGRSVAYGTNGTRQVGVGFDNGVDNNSHALLWSGTAASAINLEPLLPPIQTWTDSTAYSIDAAGNVFGIADAGFLNGQPDTFAVEWSPVPEPGAGMIMASGACGLLTRRKRAPI